MTGYKIEIDIFLRESHDPDNVMKVMNKLEFVGGTMNHNVGTNSLLVALNDKKNLSEKVKKIEKIKEIEDFYLWSYPKQEILDAISDHDYFKAFALSEAMFEFLAKNTA